MRSLNPDEAELWARVTATLRPLSRKPASEQPQTESEPQAPVKAPRAAAKTARKAPPPPPGPGTTLDGTWDRKLGAGSVSPDRVVDLHGHNLDRAWSAIDSALERAIESGERVVLLITGHSRPGGAPVQRGRIRAAVHDWLAASRHASKIAAVRPAHGRHGGGGSLYIILRRK